MTAGAQSELDTVIARKLTKRYGRHRALAGVDVEFRTGSMCALLGPNGAGKSTLLGIVSTLVRPTGGEVVYEANGKALEPGENLRRQMGVLAHDSFLYGGLTAVENLLFYARLYGVDSPETRVAELLEEVGLESAARTRPTAGFSRGMIQRVALARALLHEPRMLLLDEPFTGLDRRGMKSLSDALAAAKRAGRMLLIVTHELEAIAEFTDHVVVMRSGRVAHQEHRESGFTYDELKELYHHHSGE